MNNIQKKIIRFILLFIFISMFFFILLCYIFLMDNIIVTIIGILVFTIFIIGFLVFFIIYLSKAAIKYRNNLIATKPEKKFKYIDSFCYVTGATYEETYHIYHVIQEIKTQKFYAIHQDNTNARGFPTLYKIDNIEGFSTQKDWTEVNYEDVGSFWIDEELLDNYQNSGDTITIKNYKFQYKIKTSEMKNKNPNYNISLLDKATFITGYAKF